MTDLVLIMLLGFVGSFGHCLGMCGPLTAAAALSLGAHEAEPWGRHLLRHGLLNGGRLLSYGLVGAAIGALGSVVVASGQLAGIGSLLRQGITLVMGGLLVWIGLGQIYPTGLGLLPRNQPLAGLHHQVSRAMQYLTRQPRWWSPVLLGLLWGFLPCGFLYIAQLKAASTSNPWMGAAMMLAFGLGTLPTMLGTGLITAMVSADRRGQLFRLGGWLTLTIGLLTLIRTDGMVHYTGYAAILSLVLALTARPIQSLWAFPLTYRRTLGVGAFVFSVAHTLQMLDHTFNWQLAAIQFMPPSYQVGLYGGVGAIGLLLPAALTSHDWMVERLGSVWAKLHRLTVPALFLVIAHVILVGSNYLGGMVWTWHNWLGTLVLLIIGLGVLLLRLRVIVLPRSG